LTAAGHLTEAEIADGEADDGPEAEQDPEGIRVDVAQGGEVQAGGDAEENRPTASARVRTVPSSSFDPPEAVPTGSQTVQLGRRRRPAPYGQGTGGGGNA
jgi:hypothetical protein